MKKNSIVALGLVLAGLIGWSAYTFLGSGKGANSVSSQPEKSMHAENHLDEEDPHGEHGGRLLEKEGFRLEVAIYEAGVPPQFRVYPSRTSGEAIPLNEVQLKIRLKRLDRTEEFLFKPAGDYLLGDHFVEEPHSFDVEVQAQWQGKTYTWNYPSVEVRVRLSPLSVKNAGIEVKKAGPAILQKTVKLLGEIALEQKRVAHIVPGLDGIVKKVIKHQGDRVRAGQLIGVLESRSLADAKNQHFTAVKHREMAEVDLKRATVVAESTSKLLGLLQQNLPVDTLYDRISGLEIGASRSLLLPAYTKWNLARSVFNREKHLFEKKIASQSDYLLAEEGYKTAEANYVGLREEIAFDSQRDLLAKQKALSLADLEVQTTMQKLLSIGLSRADIESMFTDPDRPLTRYELKSPIDGVVIEKHFHKGEAVRKEDTLFLIGDLRKVRVNITIPEKELSRVRKGQKARVYSDMLKLEAAGRLTYLGSTMNEATRSVTGRVVIPNPKEQWRPGLFVNVRLVEETAQLPLAVPKEALQSMREWTVVFVKYGDWFEARPVTLGRSDDTHVEILSGLRRGETYVSKNSFAVKADIEKSGAVHSH